MNNKVDFSIVGDDRIVFKGLPNEIYTISITNSRNRKKNTIQID